MNYIINVVLLKKSRNLKLLLPSALQSRSQLENEMDVTCESPPSLRGRLVWNVTVCVTSPSITPSVGPSSTGTAVSSCLIICLY